MSSAGRRLNSVLELEQRALFYTLIQDDYVSAVATWKSNLDNLSGYNHQHTLQVELMAKALAYYGISSKRFTDYVMRTLESELKQDFSNGLHAILLESVSSNNSPPWIEELMAEDPVIERRQVSLKAKRDALEGILARLLEYDPDLVAASEASPHSLHLSILEDPLLEKGQKSAKAKVGSPTGLYEKIMAHFGAEVPAPGRRSQFTSPTLMQPRVASIISLPRELPPAKEPHAPAAAEDSEFGFGRLGWGSTVGVQDAMPAIETSSGSDGLESELGWTTSKVAKVAGEPESCTDTGRFEVSLGWGLSGASRAGTLDGIIEPPPEPMPEPAKALYEDMWLLPVANKKMIRKEREKMKMDEEKRKREAAAAALNREVEDKSAKEAAAFAAAKAAAEQAAEERRGEGQGR
ncbi:hypothetical protein DL96DRAFT_1762475 [Flagelloscypha sp. PMI_526]|nr:hypothetical protein DL96DRAFT_1762475 [Flagelloscypha sp. PMI_526]